MKKVLFIDSWKGGVNYYLRIVPVLHEAGYETLLLHLGSWGNEAIFEKEEVIGDLVVRDISYYNDQNFDSILHTEKPDLVLFLSSHTFAHRAFNRYCLYRKIPTINLYHGFVRVQAVDTNGSAYKVSWRSYASFALKRLPKMIGVTIPTYAKSLFKTKATFADWFSFGRNLVEVVTKPGGLRVAADAKTTRCLVYADADKHHAIKTYGFTKDEVISVGNPDLVQFHLSPSQIHFGIKHSQEGKYEVMYIDTALTATGLIVKSQSAYISHLLDTQKSLNKQGKKLILKPHPETKRLCDLSLLESAGVEIIENEDFTAKLENCCAVITEPSTLALIPALMALPLFLAQYDRLKELKFGEVLTSYPLSRHLQNVEELSELLGRLIRDVDVSAIENWIQQNSGPLPAEDMPKRVVDVIDKLTQEKKIIDSIEV